MYKIEVIWAGNENRKREEKCKIFQILFIILLSCGLFLPSVHLLSGKNAGYKYFKNYSYQDLLQPPQNWMVDQDSRGIIYFANGTGVLEFDGTAWRTILVPRVTLYSLAIDDNGTIYLGGRNEIGYLTNGSIGERQYVSLLNQLQDNQKNFFEVWPIYCIKDKVYFNSSEFLFQWDKRKKKMNAWKSDSSFEIIFKCGEELLVIDKKNGLMQMKDDSLNPMPGGRTLVDQEIRLVVHYDAKRFLLGTRSNGLYLYDGRETIPFPTEADEYLKKNRLSFGIRLSSSPGKTDEFALATLLGGLVVIDSYGGLKYIFNKTSGLQDNCINYVFADYQGNLWLALNRGISKIEYQSPFDVYDDRSHLPGFVTSIVKHRGILYVGTSEGLFYLSPMSTDGFQPVPGFSHFCRSLLSIGDSVLVATHDGVFQVHPDSQLSKRKVTDSSSIVLYQSLTDNNRIWVGTDKGLDSLYRNTTNNQWMEENKLVNITAEVKTIAQDQKRNLWLGTASEGLIALTFPTGIHHPVVTRYDTSQGLPGGDIWVFFAGGDILFGNYKGLFRFDQANNVFIPDQTFGQQLPGGGRAVNRMLEDKNKNVWISHNWQVARASPQTDGTFIIDSTPFRRIPATLMTAIYPDPSEDIIWMGGTEGVLRFDTRVKKNYHHDFPVLIRNVSLINEKYTIFNGCLINPGKNNHFQPPFLTMDYRYRI